MIIIRKQLIHLMKYIHKNTPLIITIGSILLLSACQTTSNQTANKTDNELSVLDSMAISTIKSRSGQQAEAGQQNRERKTDSSDVLKKRGIRRSGEGMIPEKQTEVTPVTISDEMRKQLIRDARRATKEQRYDDVIKVADAILKARPADETALALKENARILQEDLKHEKVMAQIDKVDAHERNRYLETLKEKSIPYNDLMQFTKEDEWEDIKERAQKEDSAKRLEENSRHTDRLKLSPSPVQKSISQEMQMKLEEKLSIEFIDTPLLDVIAFLQEKSKMNFYLDKNAPQINVDIKLNDVPIRMILEYILPKGLGYVVEDNIIHITVEPLELRVYDVRDLLINLEDRQDLVGQVATGAEEGSESAGEGKDTYDRVKEIINLITSTIEPQSWSVNAGKGMIAAREGMLGDIVVTHTVNIHKQVEDLLAALRSSADLQVVIEARFVSVSDNFLEELGHNILNFDTTSSRPSETRAGGDPRGSNAAGGEEEGIFTEAANTFAGTGVAAGANGLNLSYQILNGFFLEGFLRAVQESDEAETVTAPRITLSNTQRGTIKVVTTRNYIESYTIVSQTPQPVMAEIDDGTVFNVRPVVSADRKYVSLEVHPIITSVTFINSIFRTVGPVPSGGAGTGATADNEIQRPQTTKKELSVTVSVPDKGILMIGGLGSRDETKTSNGTPILSKIPIIKRFFSSDKIDRDIATTGNLIILIQPTILIREEEEARAFAKGKRDGGVRLPTYGN